MPTPKDEIVLFQYTFSPYARRVVWYLNLRKIPYTQCLQPATLPRPDLSLLSLSYRRIPFLSIGRSIYCDTRLILRVLNNLYPPSSQHPALPANPPIDHLFEHWATTELFGTAGRLIPIQTPAIQDEKFRKDREDYSGRSWSLEAVERGRPEALVAMKEAFARIEEWLADGREWIGGTERLGMSDIEAAWPFSWLRTLKGALPPEFISSAQYPLTFSYLDRFDAVIFSARSSVPKPRSVKIEEVLEMIKKGSYMEDESQAGVKNDPLGLQKGEMVEVWPTDSGFMHKDRGRIWKLDGDEIVIEGTTKGGEGRRVHFPRKGFRIRRVEGGKL